MLGPGSKVLANAAADAAAARSTHQAGQPSREATLLAELVLAQLLTMDAYTELLAGPQEAATGQMAPPPH